jgi:hypothetical protein
MSLQTAAAGHHPMTEQATTTPPTRAQTWLRIAIVVIAAIETFDALYILSIPGGNLWVYARFVLELVLAVTALALAFRRKLAGAIVPLAVIVLLQWLGVDLPSHIEHWDRFPWTTTSFISFAGNPLMAGAAIALAWRNIRLGLATLLVAIPMAIDIVTIAAFAIGVAIYGF